MTQLQGKQIVGPDIFDVKIENYIPSAAVTQSENTLADELHFDDLGMCYGTLQNIKQVKAFSDIKTY